MGSPSRSVALAAAGRVATAVTVLLQRAGWRVAGIASRSPASAERAAGFLGAPLASFEDLPTADVVLIGATDAAIPEVAGRLVPRLAEGTILWHLAGSLGPDALGEARGLRRAALHPVQACPDVATAVERLPGSAWGVTCDNGLEEWALEVVARDLSGTPVNVAAQDRVLWHAAAVTTANGIAALLAGGEEMLSHFGIADPIAVLGPLAAGAVENARTGGGGAAMLTGPVVRGEKKTVERHLASLREQAPDLLVSYKAVAAVVVEEARRAGRIDDEVATSMRSLLESE